MTRKYNLPKNVVSDPDRHGNPRFYFRVKGKPKIRLRETPGTDAFKEEVLQCRLGVLQAKSDLKKLENRNTTRKGSLRWLVNQYELRAKGTVSDRTFKIRLRFLNEVCKSKLGKNLRGELPFALIERKHIIRIRDELRQTPGARNDMVKAISALFNWAVDVGELQINPAHGIKRLKAGKGFYTWTRAEIDQYAERHGPGTRARLVLALALFTGLRRQTLAILGRQHVTIGQDGQRRIRVKPQKTEKSSDVWVDIPLLPALEQELDRLPPDQMTFLMTEYGRPFTVAGLGNLMRNYCNQAGLPHCSLHGLRKAAATIAAENGATDDGLMSVFGWVTKEQTTLYTRQADRVKLADMTVSKIDIDLQNGTKNE